MCGRLSQYRGIHDFVAALSLPNALLNSVASNRLSAITWRPPRLLPCCT